MPLTFEERDWLNNQSADLMVQVAQAGVYAGAVRAYEDTLLPWWRVLARYRRRRGLCWVRRKYEIRRSEAALLSSALQTWCDIHTITNGEQRGPIIRQRDSRHQ